MVEGLHACHQAGVAHRDMKAENILLDHEGNLKIADFGFAGPTMGRDGSGYLSTYCGTELYMAPEIHLKKAYKGSQVDIFASGIILFMMCLANQPFAKAGPKDPHYKCVAKSRADLFWKAHTKNRPDGDVFTPEFKELIEKMFTLDPEARITLEEIAQHAWVGQATPSAEEMRADF